VLVKLIPPGSHVKKGEVVAEFDRQYMLQRLDDYRASVAQLDANIQMLKADLAVAHEAHAQLVRVAKADQDKAMLDLKTIAVRSAIEAEKFKLNAEEAQAHYDQVLAETKLVEESQRAQLRAAEIDRDQARIELDRAQANADRMVIRAPIDGIAVMQSIWRKGDFGQVREGDQIWPGQFFMSIVDPSSMVLTAGVNQVDSEALRVGMKATIHVDAYPDLELPGALVGIAAMTTGGGWRANYVREVPLRLKLNSTDPRLLPDLSASADIIVQTEKQATLVPVAGIFHDTSKAGPFVFLQTPSGWMQKDVELGLTNHVQAAVRSGLSKGDVIALQRP